MHPSRALAPSSLSLLLLLSLAACGSSDTQPADETPAEGTPGDETPSDEAVEDTAAAGEPEGDAPGDQLCGGDPWQTESEDETPPAAFVRCETAADCTYRRMQGCCGGFAVAVTQGMLGCIAERNEAANCRAHCMLEEGDPPDVSTSCVSNVCLVAVGEAPPRPVAALPFDPG